MAPPTPWRGNALASATPPPSSAPPADDTPPDDTGTAVCPQCGAKLKLVADEPAPMMDAPADA